MVEAQIHDTGEEYIMKNPINVDFNVGLYNTVDSLNSDDDISAITTEPTGSNYQRQNASFSGEDKGGNWEINNDNLIIFDTSDSDEIIDGYFVTKTFQSDDKGDSSPQEHLIASSEFDELIEPGGPESGIQSPRINLNDGTTNMTNVRIRPGSAGISLDETFLFEGFEPEAGQTGDPGIPAEMVETNGVDVFDSDDYDLDYYNGLDSSDIFNGNWAFYVKGPEVNNDTSGSPRWKWAFDDGSPNEIERFNMAYQHIGLSREFRGVHKPNHNAAGDAIDFEDEQGNLVFRIVMRALSDDILLEDSRGLNTIASNVSWFDDGNFLTITVIVDYIENQFRVIINDTQSNNKIQVKQRRFINNESIAFIYGRGWSDNDELASQTFNSTSSHIIDDLEVFFT